MRVRSVAAAAAIMGFVCPATAGVRLSASPARSRPSPRVVVGKVIDRNRIAASSIRRIAVAMQVASDHTRAVLSLTIATTSTGPTQASLQLVLPSDGGATGMVATLGTERLAASEVDAIRAERLYELAVPASPEERWRDPALLQLVERDEATQTLELQAFPLTSKHMATIDIELDLPPGTIFGVQPGVGVTPRVTMTRTTATRPLHAGVDRFEDLYAAPPAVELHPYVEAEDAIADPRERVTLEEGTVQAVLAAHEKALRACFTADPAREPSLVGAVNIRAVVTKAGDVSEAEIGAFSESDAVRVCLHDEVASWKFPQTDDITTVKLTAAVVLR